MKIVSTTLAGDKANPTHLVGALTSVEPYVDEVILVWTSPGKPSLPDLPPAVEAKLTTRYWKWQKNFGAARNAALEFATKAGGSWLLWVDSDEWIDSHGEDIRGLMGCHEEIPTQALMMMDAAGTYAQPRAIHLPCAYRWEGKTHEAFGVPSNGPVFSAARFHEHFKSHEEYTEKSRRDVEILRGVVAEEPGNSRWVFYLGNALSDLAAYSPEADGKILLEEAVEVWLRRLEMRGWAEEAAWAAYRASSALLFNLGKNEEALMVAVAGMSQHAGVPELCWLAAIANHRLGRYDQAIWWAELARVHGVKSTCALKALEKRVLFRQPKALTSGPCDVQKYAYKALGMTEAAEAAEAEHREWEAT